MGPLGKENKMIDISYFIDMLREQDELMIQEDPIYYLSQFEPPEDEEWEEDDLELISSEEPNWAKLYGIE
jgi:hypothetical protein